jgi:hypothetical protein
MLMAGDNLPLQVTTVRGWRVGIVSKRVPEKVAIGRVSRLTARAPWPRSAGSSAMAR